MNDVSSRKTKAPPLNEAKLRALALRYVERYATSEAKLNRYLARKLYERGWDGEGSVKIEELGQEFVRLGYIDDAALAGAKGRAAIRKGYGERRLSQQLFQDGISEIDGAAAMAEASENAWVSAQNFARKRRIGPFAEIAADPDKKRKQLQAFLRAGHDFDLARKFVEASPGDVVS